MYLVIFAAIAPVVVLLWQILKRDSANPEPPKMLMKAFFYGMVSTVVTFIFLPVTEVIGDITMLDDNPLAQAFKQAFFSAALPEEGAKLLMLWLLLRNNPYFDERFDGIVYAVCVGMGFAAVENVLYLFSNYDSWLSVGIVRALRRAGTLLRRGDNGLLLLALSLRHKAQSCNKGTDSRRPGSGTRHLRRNTFLVRYRRWCGGGGTHSVPHFLQSAQENGQKTH